MLFTNLLRGISKQQSAIILKKRLDTDLPSIQCPMIRILGVPVIFVFCTLLVWCLAFWAPEVESTTKKRHRHNIYWKFPTEFENATQVAHELKHYKDDHYGYVVTLFVAAYIYKQAFAIPGSFFLNIVSGALFGVWMGFVISCALSTVGATLCYLISDIFGKQYIIYYFGAKISYFQQKVEENTNRLFLFLLFARMFPVSPSWLLNIIAPFINIPLHFFIASVFVGLAPYNFVCVQAGAILSELKNWHDIFDFATMLKLSSIAVVPLLLAMWIRPQIAKEDKYNYNMGKYSSYMDTV